MKYMFEDFQVNPVLTLTNWCGCFAVELGNKLCNQN